MTKYPSLLSDRPGQLQALGQGYAPYRDLLSQSWQRCHDYHLQPSHDSEPQCVGQHELNQRLHQQADLIESAKDEMASLFQQLADANCAVVLTDADGVIVHMVTSSSFAAEGQRLGLHTGGAWSERAAGTNGMGTCLAAMAPILVHREDHFFNRLSHFSCSAIPVIDPQGKTIGVLDVTNSSHLIQPTMLNLLDSTVQLIENRLIDRCFQDACSVRFHPQKNRVFTQLEGRLVVHESGRILAANRHALRSLNIQSVQVVREHKLEDIFQMSLHDMLRTSFESGFHPVTTRRTSSDELLYALAQQPFTNKAGPYSIPKSTIHAPPEMAKTVCFQDPQLINHLKTACRVITHGTPILLSGETGSGKEVFAKTVHERSPHAAGPFVAINCASLPATLIEAELFGYRAGAFTGAKRGGRQGKIVQAHRGTLFLDEIADMPLDLQARLLRVLDERQVNPLGTDDSVVVEFQLISASHQHLPDLVRQRRFREDLYYRLLGIEVRIPPLREREDRKALIHTILQAEAGSAASLSIEAEQTLMRHSWPGNLRELRHVLRTASALADGGMITPDHFISLSDRMKQSTGSDTQHAVKVSATPDFKLSRAKRAMDKTALLQCIEEQHWNMSRVAQVLGVSRNTLYRKLHNLQIDFKQEP